jgi:predicted metal-dependent HD superfamily phosphohydrolase
VDESAIVAAAGLRTRYAEPHRRYHDQHHVDCVLAAVDELAAAERIADDDRAVVRLAAWFHDAVYDPTAADNEQRSADLALTVLRADGTSAGIADEVARLVSVTTDHAVDPGDVRAAVLCDADLSILACNADRYAAYIRGVREEYAFVDDARFRHGRAAVLRRLLSREHLYATSYGREHWERLAREQVAREVALLEA